MDEDAHGFGGTRERRAVRAFGALVLVIVIGVGVTAVRQRESSRPTNETFRAAFGALCRAATAVQDDQSRTARAIFYDEVHGPLHDLAREAEATDRSAAARLLESMQAVERDLALGGTATLGRVLDRLVDAVSVGLGVVTGAPGPSCPAQDR